MAGHRAIPIIKSEEEPEQIHRSLPKFHLIQPSFDVPDSELSPPPCKAESRSLGSSPTVASPISKFKKAGHAVMGARFLAPDDWTHTTRRRSTPNIARRGSCSAILVHVQNKPRSNSVTTIPVEQLEKRRRSLTPSPSMRKLSLNSLAVKLGLKAAQKRAIEVSWQRLESLDGHKGAKAVLERAFTALCTKQPAVSMVFVSNSCIQTFRAKKTESSVHTLRDHARFYAWFLGKLVEGLDDDAKPMLDMIKGYGKAHSGLAAIGFTAKMWDKLGQVLVEHLVVQEAVRHYPEATKAWTVLTASLIDRLCSAFVQECKRK